MKKRGFTMVELLGVLVIISILSMLIIPNVSKYITKFREESYDKQITTIELAAKNWVIDHPNELPEYDGESITITIGKLKEGGYLDAILKNPQTGESFANNIEVKITKDGKTYSYEVLD